MAGGIRHHGSVCCHHCPGDREEIVPRHSAPAEILSDRRQAFLSGLMKEVELHLGFHKINTTTHHSQTDSLVERFDCTLTSMLAKTIQRGGRDWNHHIPYACSLTERVYMNPHRSRPFSCFMAEIPDCQLSMS